MKELDDLSQEECIALEEDFDRWLKERFGEVVE